MSSAGKDACYTIHDKVTIQISTSNQDLLDGYNHFFRHFSSEKKPASLQYVIRDYAVFHLPTRFFPADHGVLGFDNGFCLPEEQYAVEIGDTGITEYTVGVTSSTILWLQVLLTRQNMSMIHGAGIELGGAGVVFSGFAGSGKTTLVTHMSRYPGFRFFSDEYLLLDMEGTMYSNPVDFSIFEAHLPLLPDYHKRLFHAHFTRRKRIKWLIQGAEKIPVPGMLHQKKTALLSRIRCHVIGPDFVKIPATDLISEGQIGTTARINAAFLVYRQKGEDLTIKPVDLTEFINKITEITCPEFRNCYHYLHILSAFGIFDCTEFERKQKEILTSCFSGVKTFEVHIPDTMGTADISGSLVHFIDTAGK